MNLRSIEYFLITVEEMNFTRAAERLYISQQALSSSGHVEIFPYFPSEYLH